MQDGWRGRYLNALKESWIPSDLQLKYCSARTKCGYGIDVVAVKEFGSNVQQSTEVHYCNFKSVKEKARLGSMYILGVIGEATRQDRPARQGRAYSPTNIVQHGIIIVKSRMALMIVRQNNMSSAKTQDVSSIAMQEHRSQVATLQRVELHAQPSPNGHNKETS
jgi:hypothetical protein